jgi:hypothetical protein
MRCLALVRRGKRTRKDGRQKKRQKKKIATVGYCKAKQMQMQ